ncbi:SRPBCC family protein [Herbaspirillum robiniae]|uniref:SRPBCC family protein n=1 Tax=Herbaspirillum robiniae TaxID=2014887 RepID=A0ABX2M871_9BURK|nr:SRPBCC family protein [Herbaspirillum robiniae]NUU04437.1 SRPBCC family protein [Herbaspirillum robiniae]
MPALPVLILHVTLPVPAAQSYAFLADPRNMAQWASGLGQGLRPEADAWVAEGEAGRVTVRFAQTNPYGVLDHEVTLPDGARVAVPMRVVPNGEAASELTFTLFRQPGMDDAKFAEDAKWVMRDLQQLQQLLTPPDPA